MLFAVFLSLFEPITILVINIDTDIDFYLFNNAHIFQVTMLCSNLHACAHQPNTNLILDITKMKLRNKETGSGIFQIKDLTFDFSFDE